MSNTAAAPRGLAAGTAQTLLEPTYTALLLRYLGAVDGAVRAAVLQDAAPLAQSLPCDTLQLDGMMALHQRAHATLVANAANAAAASADSGPDTRLASAWQRLAAGEGMPLMLALLLPQQLAAQQVDTQQAAQRKSQQERHKLAAMFAQTDDLMLLLGADGRIEGINPAMRRLTGWMALEAASLPEAAWRGTRPNHPPSATAAKPARRQRPAGGMVHHPSPRRGWATAVPCLYRPRFQPGPAPGRRPAPKRQTARRGHAGGRRGARLQQPAGLDHGPGRGLHSPG